MQNHNWLTTGCIAGNGKAWGDEEDPVDILIEAAKEKKAQLAVNKKRKQVMLNSASTSNAKAHLDEILEGEDEDAVFHT